MSNGYQKSNGCGADKEGGKFFKTFFYPNAQSKHVRPLATNLRISLQNAVLYYNSLLDMSAKLILTAKIKFSFFNPPIIQPLNSLTLRLAPL